MTGRPPRTISPKARAGAPAVLALAGALAVAGLAASPAAAFPKPKYSIRTDAPPHPAPAETRPAAARPHAPDPVSGSTRAVPDGGAVTSIALTQPATARDPRSAYDPAAEAKPAGAKTSSAKTPAKRADAPESAGAKGGPASYKLQPGDTLSGVARRFGVPMKALIEVNKLPSASAVKAGATLTLPTGARDTGRDPYASGAVTVRSAPSTAASPTAKPAAKPPTGKTTVPAPTATSTPMGDPGGFTVARNTTTPAPAPAGATVRTSAGQPLVFGPTPTGRPPATNLPVAGPFPGAGQIRTLGQGRFLWPVRGDVLSPFGDLGPGLRNDGLNIAASSGTSVRAAAGGEVVYAGDDVPGYGNLVLIKHGDGWVTTYAHLGSVKVHMRDKVAQGQEIGVIGQSGGVDQPQLHFEIRYAPSTRDKARAVDPTLVLP